MCKTYYVDPQTGRDTNDGLTPEKPLATLFAVNRLALAPGDTVLLKCGSVFEKQFLHLRCCGKKDSPITIAAYGEGPAPRIDADGQGLWYQDYGCALDAPTHVYRGYVSSAVLLYDAAYVTVRDLELTNRADAVIGEQYSQPDKLERTGVAVVAKDRGTRCGITLQNLLIHDVHGNVYDKHMNNGGIYMTALQPCYRRGALWGYSGRGLLCRECQPLGHRRGLYLCACTVPGGRAGRKNLSAVRSRECRSP